MNLANTKKIKPQLKSDMLNIKQVRFQLGQEKNFDYPFFDNFPYNDKYYLFLESWALYQFVISDQHQNNFFSGLLSPKYKEKIENLKNNNENINIKNLSKKVFTPLDFDKFCHKNKDKDIITIARFIPHNVFKKVHRHENLLSITQKTLKKINYDYDLNTINEHPIYFNYFVAKPSVLERYVENLLHPAMKAIIEDEEINKLAMQDSGYPYPYPSHLRNISHTDHWTYHPFIAERLINIFSKKNHLKVTCYDTTSDYLFILLSLIRKATNI